MTIEFVSYFTGAVELGGRAKLKYDFFTPLFFCGRNINFGTNKAKDPFFFQKFVPPLLNELKKFTPTLWSVPTPLPQ